MKTLTSTLAVSLLVCLDTCDAVSVSLRDRDSRGYILDQTGTPCVGYSVLIVGTTYGGSTDANGRYSIFNVPIGTYAVRYSVIGYGNVTIANVVVVAGQTTRLIPTTNANDPGPGSLRQAITYADSLNGNCYIHFMLPGPGYVITPLSPLPTITRPVLLDATTQPGVGYVELDGSSAGTGASGLTITSGGCIIRGLVINRFDSDGIDVMSGEGNVIEGNKIGTDAMGAAALGKHS